MTRVPIFQTVGLLYFCIPGLSKGTPEFFSHV